MLEKKSSRTKKGEGTPPAAIPTDEETISKSMVLRLCVGKIPPRRNDQRANLLIKISAIETQQRKKKDAG